MLPVVAIVGRPNVGKSTLFNRLIRERKAIVESMPGVTRDRNYGVATYEGRRFILIDTGGFEPESEDPILIQMRRQSQLAVDEADVVLFMCDAIDGPAHADKEILQFIRGKGKPVFVCINKVDGPSRENDALSFYELGVDKIYTIGALNGYGLKDLLNEILETPEIMRSTPAPEGEEKPVLIAIVGRPNTGKSTLVNKLVGEERSIVSDVAGTTRDSIDTKIKFHGRDIVIIDTAGIRKKASISFVIERFSVVRALRSIERADVVVILLDANEPAMSQDVKIASFATEQGKGLIIALNKWDNLEKDNSSLREKTETVREELTFASWAPIIAISGKTGQRVNKILPTALDIYDRSGQTYQTRRLNEALEEAVSRQAPALYQRRRVRLNYITQTGTRPPGFAIFSNMPWALQDSYKRYLDRCFREKLNLEGIPLKLYFKRKN